MDFAANSNKHRAFSSVTACALAWALALLWGSSARAQALTPAWVELGPNGTALARIVVSGKQDCPAIRVDGATRRMTLREPVPEGFRPACEFRLSAATRVASISGIALALPHPNPQRVVVIGDTGCRIKGNTVQNCLDPDKWAFAQVAAQAASEKSDLIIHVGDYLYRESPCPPELQNFCGGTPIGDNWDTWNADFFAPGAKLLGSTVWAFDRGNHEDCNRAWRGWFYYLDPRKWTGQCQEYSAAYRIRLGKFELVMFDSSAVRENDLDMSQVEQYTGQLRAMHIRNAWLVAHHPFWGFSTETRGNSPVKPLTATLENAWVRAAPKGYRLVLSGHIHLFEFVTLDDGRPPQMLAGDGGTEMAVPIQISMKGTMIHGASVKVSRSRREFGYTLLSREGAGWRLQLKDRRQQVLMTCYTGKDSSDCEGGVD